MLVYCNHCRNRVLPKDDDVCPNCHQTIDAEASAAMGAAALQAAQQPAPTSTTVPARRSFRDLIASRAKAGIFLGAALAVYGAFDGSYQRRGAGYAAGGKELLWVGAGVAVLSFVLFLLCRRKGS